MILGESIFAIRISGMTNEKLVGWKVGEYICGVGSFGYGSTFGHCRLADASFYSSRADAKQAISRWLERSSGISFVVVAFDERPDATADPAG